MGERLMGNRLFINHEETWDVCNGNLAPTLTKDQTEHREIPVKPGLPLEREKPYHPLRVPAEGSVPSVITETR